MMSVPHEDAAKKVHPKAHGFRAVTAGAMLNKKIIGWVFMIPSEGSAFNEDWVWMTTDHVISSDRQSFSSDARRSLRDFIRAQRQHDSVLHVSNTGDASATNGGTANTGITFLGKQGG